MKLAIYPVTSPSSSVIEKPSKNLKMMGQNFMNFMHNTYNNRRNPNRERFDPRFESPFDEYNTFIEDLAYDSRIRHLADIPSYRGFERRAPILRMPARNSTAMIRHSKDVLPFGRAMRKLYATIVRAEELYSTFIAEFDGDVAQIKRYATAAVMDNIWRMRVIGKKDPKTALEGESKEDDETVRLSNGKFDDMKTDMAMALSTALDSVINDGTNSKRIDFSVLLSC
jgi:hypothetical protein